MKKGTLVLHAAQIATPVGSSACFGSSMNKIRSIRDGALCIENGRISAVDTTQVIINMYNAGDYETIDATGRTILPGFVDSHTHFVFAGYRADEFALRLKGASYMEIMQAGGGISATMTATRQASAEELHSAARKRLSRMLSMGVTTVEGKSGYGLDFETEIHLLELLNKVNTEQPVEVVSTYLGAHAVPPEYQGDAGMQHYVDFMIKKVLPYIAAHKLAVFCDVFCEKGVFTVQESRRLLEYAKSVGLKCKIHADEIVSSGGAELAASLNAVSADHLLRVSDKGIRALADFGVVATLLPCTAFCLDEPCAPARKMIDAGCAVALASDFNPGSCFTMSVPLIFALACVKMKMTIEEALTAFTLNGAAAVGKADVIGSIEKGKQADFVLLDYPDYKFLVYHTGMNCVHSVFKKGICVYSEGRSSL